MSCGAGYGSDWENSFGMKQAILNLMLKTDAFRAARYFFREQTPILMYHRFSEVDETYKTSRRALTAHLEYVTSHYKVISLAEVSGLLKDGRAVPPNSCVITIDDGYRDAYETAFPMLKKFGVPATIFVVTDFLDGKCWIWTDKMRYVTHATEKNEAEIAVNGETLKLRLTDTDSRFTAAARINTRLKTLGEKERDAAISALARELDVAIPNLPPAEFAPMTWDEAREMDSGGVAVESHTITHPILTNVEDGSLLEELIGSRARLETELQREVKMFCYPNGNCAAREFSAARAAGYDCAVTTDLRLSKCGDDRFALPRIDAENELSRFAQAVSGFDGLKFSR
jgi:peptidoglycan/xylan/chitin deacetylase (PgdA/CDA1 family)